MAGVGGSETRVNSRIRKSAGRTGSENEKSQSQMKESFFNRSSPPWLLRILNCLGFGAAQPDTSGESTHNSQLPIPLPQQWEFQIRILQTPLRGLSQMWDVGTRNSMSKTMVPGFSSNTHTGLVWSTHCNLPFCLLTGAWKAQGNTEASVRRRPWWTPHFCYSRCLLPLAYGRLESLHGIYLCK